MDTAPHIILASQSPRRRELLALMGLPFEVLTAQIDEDTAPFTDPKTYVLAMARGKAELALDTLKKRGRALAPHELLLSSDTAIAIDDEILGKPVDFADFKAMMARLSGRTHIVYSAIALYGVEDEQNGTMHSAIKLSENFVTFMTLPEGFAEYYWETGEPHDKAGGYAIQGLMAPMIEKIEGSFHAIMGLPLYELREALAELGYNYPIQIAKN